MLQEQPFEVIEIEAEWDPLDEGKCLPCNPMISDAGCFQCSQCCTLFLGSAGIEQVKKCIQQNRQGLWYGEWRKLLKVKMFQGRGRLSRLTALHYSYRDSHGIIINERTFYELAQNN